MDFFTVIIEVSLHTNRLLDKNFRNFALQLITLQEVSVFKIYTPTPYKGIQNQT